MKDLLVTRAVCVLLAVAANSQLPQGGPTYSSLDKNPNASLGTMALARVGMSVASWDVQDYYVFKTAHTSIGGHEITLVTTPFSNGKWSRLDR